jgi:hypothetical protein
MKRRGHPGEIGDFVLRFRGRPCEARAALLFCRALDLDDPSLVQVEPRIAHAVEVLAVEGRRVGGPEVFPKDDRPLHRTQGGGRSS